MNPYRDENEARYARLDALLERLEKHRERARELENLEKESREIEAEIALVQKEIASAAERAGQRLLDHIEIATPCSADWSSMQGDDKQRFCIECKKYVHNLSAMRRDEAEALLIELEGEGCVRLYRRADGTVLTSDCEVGVRKKRLKLRVLSLVGGGLSAAGSLFAYEEVFDGELFPADSTCASHPPKRHTPSGRRGYTAGGAGAGHYTRDTALEAQLLTKLVTQLKALSEPHTPAERTRIENEIQTIRADLNKIPPSSGGCKAGDPMCPL